MAGGVAVPLKPKTKIVWGKRPHVDDQGEMDPEASSSGQRRTEPAPDRGAGSGKDDDETLPDIRKLSMAEEKKDDMDVDQDVSKKGQSGTGKPKPRDTEAGRADLSKMTNCRALPSRNTERLPPPMSTAERKTIGGSFPRTLRLTWRSPCLPRQRS